MKFWQWLAMFAFRQVQKSNKKDGRLVTELRIVRGPNTLIANQFPSHVEFIYDFEYPIISNGRHFHSINYSARYTEE